MLEPEVQPTQPAPVVIPHVKIRPELIIALISLVVSMTAMFTNLFQTNLQREQQQTSVWPYIECNASISDQGFIFVVANKGVGPAIITQEAYRYKNVTYHTLEDLAKVAVSDSSLTYYNYGTNPVKGRVLSPQETIRVFNITDMRLAEKASALSGMVEIYIEYQSIYGKKWVCHGNRVEEVD